jgi:CheY-like chemotaxis protein
MDTSVSVLVVDDSQTMANIVSALVRQCEFSDVEQALSGEAALAALRNRRRGLVIADINMVGMNGVELLRAVRQDIFLANTCFVLMTAMRHRELIDAAMYYQADSIIMKPFTKDVLKCKLADITKLKFRHPG